ncbi:beta strand repeat-containing protein, partial [Saccharibacter floricola]
MVYQAADRVKNVLRRGARCSTMSLLMMSTTYVGVSGAFAQTASPSSYKDVINKVVQINNGPNSFNWLTATPVSGTGDWNTGTFQLLDTSTGQAQSSTTHDVNGNNVIFSGSNLVYNAKNPILTASTSRFYTANVAIVNGATLNSTSGIEVGYQNGSNIPVSVYVDGSASTLNNTGDISVDNTGILYVSNGNLISDSLTISGQATLGKNTTIRSRITNNNGGTLTLNGLNVASGLIQANDGVVNVQNGSVVNGTFTNNNDGTINLDGASVGSLNNSGTATLDKNATISNGGTITSNQGSTLNLNGTQIASGVLQTVNGTVTATGATINDSVTNNGTVSLASGAKVMGSITSTGSGILNVNSGGASAGSLNGSGNTTLAQGSGLTLTGQGGNYSGTITGTNDKGITLA